MLGSAKTATPVELMAEADADAEIPAGTILAGRYEVERLLGKGGMGTVYLAEHVEVGRKVAVKILSSEWSAHASLVRRFRAEARTASAIGHPNIVQVFDAGTLPDGRLFLVMEHLAGRELTDELHESRRLEPARACEIVRQVALALGAAHRAGVVHRDIKPSNVMLVPQGDREVVKVLDFGIAANAAATANAGERLTDPGSLMGTPEYMAPEQATGEAATAAFDVYALGVMLYELLTGVLPISALHAFELLSLKINRPAPPLRIRRPDLPPSLTDLVGDCLKIQPDERPADGDAVAARLSLVLEDLTTGTWPEGPEEEAGRAVEAAAPDAPAPEVPIGRPPPPSPARPEPRREVRPWLGLAGAALALGLGFVGYELWTDARATAAEIELAEPAERTPAPQEPAPAPEEPAPVRPAALPSPTPEAAASQPVPEDISPDAPAPVKATAQPTRSSRPPAVSDEHLTPRCQRVRAGADEARRSQRWAALRDAALRRECWASAAEARKWQTKALMELGDFSGCVSVGKGLKDQEVQGWLKLCQKRVGG